MHYWYAVYKTTLIALLASWWLLPAQAATSTGARNVLVLYSNDRMLPGNVAVDRGLRAAIEKMPQQRTEIFSEFLDRPHFGGEFYENTVTTYLREKYAARPPNAIVVVSENALQFVLQYRKQLFPSVPVVYTAVSKSRLQSLPPLPADVVGVPIEYDFAGAIEQALRWHPQARQLVVVTGASDRDRAFEARLRHELPSVANGVMVEFLAGQSSATVVKRLSMLGADSVVFTPGFFEDSEGRLSNPRDSAALMAAASTAPMYGSHDTFIGTGIVGGRSPSFEDSGRQAGQIVGQLLAGAAPASLQLPQIMPNALRVDWRQVRRWGIDEKQIPADAVVYFREPTLWEAYRNVVIATAAVIMLLALMVVTLLVERGRRRVAELAVQEQRSQLAHASRLAIAGELTASIAHEINQPLGAILTNADTAELILQADGDRRADLSRIMADIRRDDLRASDVIRRLRTLLVKHEVERQPFDLNAAVNDVANLLRAEGERRRVTIDFRPMTSAIQIIGDAIQIQQVLINLVLNAMDAVADETGERRSILVSVEKTASGSAITVRDRGHGVSPEHLTKLFDSFFSTKQRGMGLGLSIARTIVEAHGGRIWAEIGLHDGAIFHVELPAYGLIDTSSPVPA